MTPKQRITKVDPKRYVELHEQGLNGEQIAQLLGVSAATVTRWMRRLAGDGWSSFGRHATQAQIERIVELVREGVPDGWIAEDVGLSQKTVADHRRRLGAEPSEEWKATRLDIQHNPKLFNLHLQFAPIALSRG